MKKARVRVSAPSLSIKDRTGLATELYDVLSSRTLGALNDVELDALAFGERLEAAALDG